MVLFWWHAHSPKITYSIPFFIRINALNSKLDYLVFNNLTGRGHCLQFFVSHGINQNISYCIFHNFDPNIVKISISNTLNLFHYQFDGSYIGGTLNNEQPGKLALNFLTTFKYDCIEILSDRSNPIRTPFQTIHKTPFKICKFVIMSPKNKWFEAS